MCLSHAWGNIPITYSVNDLVIFLWAGHQDRMNVLWGGRGGGIDSFSVLARQEINQRDPQ